MLKEQLLKQIREEEARHNEVMQILNTKLKAVDTVNRLRKQEQYREEKRKLQDSGKVIKQYLNVGDTIKVTGSRAGKYRRIIALQEYCVIGQVVGQVRDPKNPGNVIWKDYYNITEQGYDKITHVLKDGQFVKADKIIEASP